MFCYSRHSRFDYLIVTVILILCSKHIAAAAPEQELNSTKIANRTQLQPIAKAQSCMTSSDCSGSCQCSTDTCYDSKVFATEVNKCRACFDDDDCVAEKCIEVGSTGFCGDCATDAVRKSEQVCRPKNQPLPIAENGLQPPDCVETKWLKDNGFSHGILRQRKVSKTLCMDGLPCGTEGHLLRSCSKAGDCQMVTYKQLCQMTGDCTVKYTEVSRLSAAMDWSMVRMETCGVSGMSVSLTSLSVRPDGGDLGLSHLVAGLGEKLISAGLGHELDRIILLWDDLATNAEHLLRTAWTVSVN